MPNFQKMRRKAETKVELRSRELAERPSDDVYRIYVRHEFSQMMVLEYESRMERLRED
jgi:hypothetical protein